MMEIGLGVVMYLMGSRERLRSSLGGRYSVL